MSNVRAEACSIIEKVPQDKKPQLAGVILIEIVCSVISMLCQCYSTFSTSNKPQACVDGEFTPETNQYSHKIMRRVKHCYNVACRQHQAYMSDDDVQNFSVATLDHVREGDHSDDKVACVFEEAGAT